ncbi:hypothetical protein P4H32_29385 [Bacillus cereus]|nr:hypothetical protein [Bacillus cereus]
MEYVIDADGNVIPFEHVLEKVEITLEHWEEIAELVKNIDRETVKKIRNERVNQSR